MFEYVHERQDEHRFRAALRLHQSAADAEALNPGLAWRKQAARDARREAEAYPDDEERRVAAERAQREVLEYIGRKPS